MTSYNDGHRELPRNMNVPKLVQCWLGTYFDFKQWKREDTTNGVFVNFQFQVLKIKVSIMTI